MESVNESFDVNGKFGEIEGIFEVFKEDGHMGEYKGMAIKIVSGLTDILKEINQKSPNKRLIRRVLISLIMGSSIGFVNLLIRLIKKKMLYGAYLGTKGMAKFCSHS